MYLTVKKTYQLMTLITLACLFSSPATSSINITNSAAEVVYLRTDCTNVSNCATTLREIINWTWDTRQPSESSPLLIDIGPGTFQMGGRGSPDRLCDGGGNVTFKGSGRGNTIIGGGGKGGPGFGLAFGALPPNKAVVSIRDCDNLAFQDLTIRSAPNNTQPIDGIAWFGGGSSVWTNVAVESGGYGWADVCTSSGELSTHDWFSSSITSTGSYYNVAYASTCADNSFYGGELIALRDPSNTVTAGALVGAAVSGPDGNIAIYGSLVRAINPIGGAGLPAYDPLGGHGGLSAENQGAIHMHGGIISVKSETSNDSHVFGVNVSSGGTIHTPDTAFGINASGNGIVRRIIDSGGTVSSPFTWPQGDTPPAISSLVGADTFVETDCDSSGDCSGNGANLHPHMMVYDDACNENGPWFDKNTNRCRGELILGAQIPATAEIGDTFIETDCNSDGDCDTGTGTETHLMIYNDACNVTGTWFDTATGLCRGEAPPETPTNGTTPPVSAALGDTFVETDCSTSGCQTTGADPHFLFYNESCQDSGGPWYDLVTNSCR